MSSYDVSQFDWGLTPLAFDQCRWVGWFWSQLSEKLKWKRAIWQILSWQPPNGNHTLLISLCLWRGSAFPNRLGPTGPGVQADRARCAGVGEGEVCYRQTRPDFVRLRWSSFPSIRPVIHPSNFLIPEEEDDGRGGGRRKRQQQIKNFKSTPWVSEGHGYQ
jgi:hypothetical protein